MAVTIGIDLRKPPTACVATVEGSRPTSFPTRWGERTTPERHLVHQRRRAPGGNAGTTPCGHQSGADVLLGEAAHGHRLARSGRRPELHPAGALGDDLTAAQEGCRSLPGPAGRQGCHHRARVLQRHPSVKPPRTPGASPGSRCCASLTNPRVPHSPTGWTTARRKKSWCTTWAAAPSTCRLSRSATA